jgi:hypothetical protein
MRGEMLHKDIPRFDGMKLKAWPSGIGDDHSSICHWTIARTKSLQVLVRCTELWSYIHRTPETVEFLLSTVEIAIPTTDASHLTRYVLRCWSYTPVSNTTFNDMCVIIIRTTERLGLSTLVYLACE